MKLNEIKQFAKANSSLIEELIERTVKEQREFAFAVLRDKDDKLVPGNILKGERTIARVPASILKEAEGVFHTHIEDALPSTADVLVAVIWQHEFLLVGVPEKKLYCLQVNNELRDKVLETVGSVVSLPLRKQEFMQALFAKLRKELCPLIENKVVEISLKEVK